MRRRRTRQVRIGNVKIGGGAQVSIQSMAKTDTKDAPRTVSQIRRLKDAGCEIVRLAVKDEKATRAFARIKEAVDIPIVADIHFNYKLALIAIEEGADAVRLNPGNMKKESQIKEIIEAARKKKIPIRIGANSGSMKLSG